MDIHQNGEVWYIDPDRLADDLKADKLRLVTISRVGELVIDRFDTPGIDYSGREVWQARPYGCPSGTKWAGMDFAFCRSVIEADKPYEV